MDSPTHLQIIERVAVVETKIDMQFNELARRLDTIENQMAQNARASHEDRVDLRERVERVEAIKAENKGRDRVIMGGIALVVSGAVAAFFRWVGTF